MKKIPTIFKRNPDNLREILAEPHSDCLWVFTGEGVATRKYDGTCVKIENGKYFKRREVKEGKPVPSGFVEVGFDLNTGKRVGWIEIDPSEKENKWHMEGLEFTFPLDFKNLNDCLPNGTYELVGPKIQGNPENSKYHALIYHACAERYANAPRSFDELREWLKEKDIEGVVFHHPDGRMGKIKKRDFGQKRV